MSALPPKADIMRVAAKSLLMTQSGHLRKLGLAYGRGYPFRQTKDSKMEKPREPLLDLWDEWNRLDAEIEARRADPSETEEIAWGKRREELVKQMAKHVPLTPESAAVLVQLLTYWAKYKSWPFDDQPERILTNLGIWIEGMDGQE